VWLLVAAAALAAGRQCPLEYPASYIAYHLGPNQKIVIDGKLDDLAWTEVPYSTDFIDIQGPTFPRPRFDTTMKIRWDDDWLYVGGFLQETEVWANMTEHNSVVFNDNDFEFFCDPDGSTHYYKELEINAINTVWDLMLNRPYLDGGSPNTTFDMTTMQTAVYVDGPVNNPNGGKDLYWTVELMLPLKDYVTMCSWATAPPKHNDLWRINFSRVEYYVHVVDGHYEKIPDGPQDNWVWQSQSAINMHLPERWGYLQFSTQPVNTTPPHQDPRFLQLQALAQVYYAQHEFAVRNGYFTPSLTQLVPFLPPWVFDGSCGTANPQIDATSYSFRVNVSSRASVKLPVGHIRNDRFTWFDPFVPHA